MTQTAAAAPFVTPAAFAHPDSASRPVAPAEARPGRFHLYAAWFCPWAQRSTLVLELAGLRDVVGVTYVDGWQGRRLSVPALWDVEADRLHSNDVAALDADLATAFAAWSATGAELFPHDLRDDIDAVDAWVGPAVNHGVRLAAAPGDEGAAAAARLRSAFTELDRLLAETPYLLGNRLTLADVRLWVTLARFDARANADGRLGPHLPEYRYLWDYARSLYQRPAFRVTTDFASFTEPGAPALLWDQPVELR